MPASGHAPPEAVMAVSVIFTIMAVIVVAARLYARLGLARNAGWDDLFIGVALIFAIATTIAMCIQARYGMGRHIRSLSPDEVKTHMKAFYVGIWVYGLSLSSTKISILLQYLRIFPQKSFRLACRILLGVVVISGFYAFFTAVFSCTPIEYFWDRSVGGHCLYHVAIAFANTGISIGTDILTAILPLPVLKQLELPECQRHALMIVFALGGFTCIVSILRLQPLYQISTTKDFTWDGPLAAIWSNVEINIAIVCSCLPTLRCIFPHLVKLQQLSEPRSSQTQSRSRTSRFVSRLFSRIATTASPPPEQGPYGGGGGAGAGRLATQSETSLEALGRGLNLVDSGGKQKGAFVPTRSSFEDIELGGGGGAKGGMREAPRGEIHVLTAIEQEVAVVERTAESDCESPRHSVRDQGYF